MDFRIGQLLGFMAAIILCLAPSVATAYDETDVAYITDSKDWDVVDYVICLEEEVAKAPRRISFSDAINDGELSCRRSGFRLPRSRSQPDAITIREFILECGFRPSGAAIGAICDPIPVRTVARCRPPQKFIGGRCRGPAVAVPRCRPPQKFVGGRCRGPAVAVPRCRPPQKFIGGRCRGPAVAVPRCRPPQKFVGGRCRGPAVAVPRCRPPQKFVGGRCRGPAVAVPRCRPPQKFIGGRCRGPAVAAPRCVAPKKFVGGRCR